MNIDHLVKVEAESIDYGDDGGLSIECSCGWRFRPEEDTFWLTEMTLSAINDLVASLHPEGKP